LAKYGLERTVESQLVQSPGSRLEDLPVQTTAGTWQAFSHADLFGYAPVALKARLHWPLVASQSKLTQQSGSRPLVHSSWTQPSQLSLVFNHEWQQVLHTSQPENVWPQTFELLNAPQFKGGSHGGTTPVTERAARAAKAASFMLLFLRGSAPGSSLG
jgi:hypothetical protein